LPGGTIIITDEMIKTAETIEEVLAVLAHEIGHVEFRHTMRNVLQGSVVAVAVATITSDAATLSGAVTGLPLIIMNTKYSREFETEADNFGFNLLRQKGHSPAAFASIMERIARSDGPKDRFAFLSTHPLTDERIARARNAAGK
jgi:predicted Zn-dependent protease